MKKGIKRVLYSSVVVLFALIVCMIFTSCAPNELSQTVQSDSLIHKDRMVHKEISYYGYKDYDLSTSDKKSKAYKKTMYISDDAPDFLISDYKDGVCINGYLGYSEQMHGENNIKETIEIPEQIDDKPVIKIGVNILHNGSFDCYVAVNWLLDSTQLIFYDYMYPYPMAVDIVIPSQVQEISELSSIWLCENIIVDEDNPYYSSQDGILYNKDKTILIAVPQYYANSEITVPEGTLQIFNDSMSVVDDWNDAYSEEPRQSYSLKIPSSVTKYCGAKGLIKTPRIEAIDVDENNPNFSSDDGVLYNKDKTVLLHYPALKKGDIYTLPDSVKRVAKNAFDYREYLKELKAAKDIKGMPEW